MPTQTAVGMALGERSSAWPTAWPPKGAVMPPPAAMPPDVTEGAVKSHIDYEAAFEQFLQKRQTPYVAVDEAKRAAFRDAKLKSFDFIVYSTQGTNWLVDVKGRRWIGRGGGRRSGWENWVTQEDLSGLRQWQEVFGRGFAALLVFAYRLDGEGTPPWEIVYEHRGAQYVFAGVPLDEYEPQARVRSPKWGTVSLPVREFAQHVRPIAEWL